MKRVLLVDVEKSSSDIIKFFIKKNGLPLDIVGEASNGREALIKINTLKPDIVFMDIEMPWMNGLQVMDQIKKNANFKTVFIVITAYDVFSYVQQALRLGAEDYLLKPVMYEQFCETMKRVLGYEYFDNPSFNSLLAYIDEHYMEELHCSECAEMFNMSQSNILRLYKKYLNCSFTDYINDVRIHKAIEMLERGDSIKDVSGSVGYNNLNYFYRIFKKKMGVTPKEYIMSGEENK